MVLKNMKCSICINVYKRASQYKIQKISSNQKVKFEKVNFVRAGKEEQSHAQKWCLEKKN